MERLRHYFRGGGHRNCDRPGYSLFHCAPWLLIPFGCPVSSPVSADLWPLLLRKRACLFLGWVGAVARVAVDWDKNEMHPAENSFLYVVRFCAGLKS